MEQNTTPAIDNALTAEQYIQRLEEDNKALQRILGVLITRANGVLILKQQHRQQFEQVLQGAGRFPLLKIDPIGKSADLRVTISWEQPAPEAPAPPPVPAIHHLLEGLAYMGFGSIEVDTIRAWSPEEKMEVLQWCAINHAAKNAGDGSLAITIPPTPAVIVAATAHLPVVEPECGNETPLVAQETQVPGAESSALETEVAD